MYTYIKLTIFNQIPRYSNNSVKKIFTGIFYLHNDSYFYDTHTMSTRGSFPGGKAAGA
jgi:hypothetical protein